MNAKSFGFVFLAFSFSVASGQPTVQASEERTFQFAHTQRVQNAQEIPSVVKMIAGIAQVHLSTVHTPFTLTVQGTAEQLALAEWLFVELDRPESEQPNPITREYRLPGTGENVVCVYHANNIATVRDLQELATSIHATGLRLLTTYSAQRVVVMRAPSDQMAAAEWLLSQMDKAGNRPLQHSASGRYLMPDAQDRGVLEVFFLAHIESVQDFQMVRTAMLTITELRSAFTYRAPHALAVRGNVGQIAMAEWLFNELDQPNRSPKSAKQECEATRVYRAPESIDDVLRIFCFNHPATVAEVDRTAQQVRTVTRSPWVFPYESLGTIVFRGTTAQSAQAERLIEEMNKP